MKDKSLKKTITEKMGHLLSNYRRSQGKTQNEYAQILKIPTSTYKKYEQGVCSLNYELLNRINRCIGIDLTPLITDDSQYFPDTDYFIYEKTVLEKIDYLVCFAKKCDSLNMDSLLDFLRKLDKLTEE